MRQLFFLPAIMVFFLLLTACSLAIVPQVGGAIPCQIQSEEQVEQAILAGLTDQHWEILSASEHIVEARKKVGQVQAVVDVAYGYRGFSIEYQRSQNMDYDVEADTIGTMYVKWVNALAASINKILKKEVERNPPVACSDKNALR